VLERHKNEGDLHYNLKYKAAELIKKIYDVEYLEAEYATPTTRDNYKRFIDIFAILKNNQRIYCEIKTRKELMSAISQIWLTKDFQENRNKCIGIVIVKDLPKRAFKNYFRRSKEYFDFINSVTVYTFDNDLNLTKHEIVFKENEGVFIDGVNLLK